MDITTFAITASFILLVLLVVQTWYHESVTERLTDRINELEDDARFDAAVIRDMRNQRIADQHTLNQMQQYYAIRSQVLDHPMPVVAEPTITEEPELPFNVVEFKP